MTTLNKELIMMRTCAVIGVLVLFQTASVCPALGTGAAEPAQAAEQILSAAGIRGGLVVHLGCGEGRLTPAFHASDAFLVHGLARDAATVEKARATIRRKGLYGPVSVEMFDGRHLPYVDNLVNLVVAQDLGDVPKDEVRRVLAPRGVAYVKGRDGWTKTVKPRPEGYDEWTHDLHAPDNNAVSRDKAIRSPLEHLQWQDGPRWARHHDHTSSIPAVVSAGGRLFCIQDEGPLASILWPSDWRLVARDAFNGTRLWNKRIRQWTNRLWRLKSGPSNTPRRLVAKGDSVYVTLDLTGPVRKLDAATGEKLNVYEATENTEEILLKDGVLYLVVNPSIKPDRGAGNWDKTSKTVMAVRENDGRILWRRELSWIAPVTLTVGDTNVYLCTGPRIVALDKADGKKRWQSKELPWRKKMPTYFAPTLVAADGCLLYAGGENWHEHAGSKGRMTCLDAKTGRIKWQQPHLPSGYQSPQDIFVIDGLAWCGSLNSKPGEFDKRYPDVAPSTGDFIAYDLETGEREKRIPRDADCFWFHHRCHRAKATHQFFLTSRTGIEMINTETGHWDIHHWVRGACLYGIMPANGLIYAPPHPCACYQEAKLDGFNALAGAGSRTAPAKSVPTEDRLQTGPAYETLPRLKSETRDAPDWPTFRANAPRSGSTHSKVAVNHPDVKWEARIGGKLSQPIVAGKHLFVAAIDSHTVYALDRHSGQTQWTYTTGGRVDSPPTYYKGAVIFGSADGCVYCLRASDGVLAWRFLAAPLDRRMTAWGQVESVWPVHGSVLVRDGVIYVVAGRSMFLDGGLTLYRLDAKTGKILSKTEMDDVAPDTGKNLHEYVAGIGDDLSMPVAKSDILSTEGDYIYMRSQPFDLKGKRTRIRHISVKKPRGKDTHLFAPHGFLTDTYWHRSFWVYGRSVLGGHGYGLNGRFAPCGKIMVQDQENVYIFGRKQNDWGWRTGLEYRLFSVARSLPPAKKKTNAHFAARWSVEAPVLARAMVKAGDTLFICGAQDIVNEPKARGLRPKHRKLLRKQARLFAGEEGSILWTVSAADGKELNKTRIDFMPVFDGMIAAGERLYLATKGGKVICVGGK